MPSSASKTFLAATGGLAAAIGSALCCAGPLVAVFVGVSGAGLAATFEPLRPWFVGATILALGAGFALLRREERQACVPGSLCASPRAMRWMRGSLWAAAILAVPLLSFPWWSKFLLS